MTRTLSFLPCRSSAVLSSGVILISFRNWTNFSLFVPIWSRYCWNVMPCANRSLVTMGPPLRLASDGGARSEEHTSELQSHSDLVCRLLLEKKDCSNRQ